MCSVGECDRAVYAAGLCNMHHHRLFLVGDVNKPAYVELPPRPQRAPQAPPKRAPKRLQRPRRKAMPVVFRECSQPDCDGRHYSRGLCQKHYRRWVRWGDPTVVRPGHRFGSTMALGSATP